MMKLKCKTCVKLYDEDRDFLNLDCRTIESARVLPKLLLYRLVEFKRLFERLSV